MCVCKKLVHSEPIIFVRKNTFLVKHPRVMANGCSSHKLNFDPGMKNEIRLYMDNLALKSSEISYIYICITCIKTTLKIHEAYTATFSTSHGNLKPNISVLLILRGFFYLQCWISFLLEHDLVLRQLYPFVGLFHA